MDENNVPSVRDFFLGGNGLEAYYVEDPRPAMAVDPGLADADERRMWELVAHGLLHGGLPDWLKRAGFRAHPELGGIPFWGADSPREVPPLVVAALQAVVREMEPDWVAAVWHAMHMTDDERVLAAWSGVPLEATCAIVDLLDAGGLARWAGFFGDGE